MTSPNIIVTSQPEYMDHQSKPQQNRFVFAYTITISNQSNVVVQLLSRHWLIKDANAKVEEVYGEGVIGEQPVIGPGESYTYTSGAVLETEIGTMEGRYFMVSKDLSGNVSGEFEVAIPRFTLTIPRTVH